MEQGCCAPLPSLARRSLVFMLMLAGFAAAQLAGQDVRVRVLDGRNGRPVSRECVNVWVGPVHGPSLVIPTNKDGVALLHLAAGASQARAGRRALACKGMAVIDPIVKYADTIEITGDYYVPCQRHPPESPWLSFSVKTVLHSGDASANGCGRIEVSPEPGELILFVRPMHWWERD